MSLSLQTTHQNKIVSIEFNDDMIQIIKNMYFRDSSDEEFKVFLNACRRTGLDPTMRQIHPIKRAGKMTIQTGIDGFRLIAERTGKYSPGKEPSYIYDQQSKLQSTTAYVKKQTMDGTWHEVSATAFWNEYVVMYNGKPGQFWAKMPHGQLAKCAEALVLRKAFPAELSGIYTTDEMAQSENSEIVNTQASYSSEVTVIEQKQKEEQTLDDLSPQEVIDYLEKIGGIKGGSGKTTIATNLTVMRSASGKKVLLVDAE
jgi:phage recombination protein Bet